MTLICFASQKGSPGVTSAALAVAAALRPGSGRRKLLLEADASGGTLALRYRLPTEPGLVTLAAAIRAGIEPGGLWPHTQELPGGLPVVVGPAGPDQVHAALTATGARLGRHLAELPDVDVICDLGRLGPGSPAVDLVAQSTALLVVARPTAEQLQPAARRMVGLRPAVRHLGWVLIGERPYGPAEVEATFGLPVVGLIADDPRSVDAIERGAVSKRLRRHPFVRSATTLAATLSAWLSPASGPGPADDPPDPAGARAAVVADPVPEGPRPVDSAGPTADGAGSPDRSDQELVEADPDRPLFAVGPPTYGVRPRGPADPVWPAPSPGRTTPAWAPSPPASADRIERSGS